MRKALSCALLVLAACGYTETHDLVLRPSSGPARHPVEVYVGDQAPRVPYYEVALIQVVGHGGDANPEDVTRAIAERATQLGCDAVVRVHVDQGYTMAHGFGVCVEYVRAQPQRRVSPSPEPAPAPTPEPEPGDVTM